MTKQIVIFGGSFNPPGLHHRQIAEALARQFDEVIVVPCGPRPDKQAVSDVDPIFRATLAHIGFAGLRGVEVDLFDLEQSVFSRTHELDARYARRGEVWHVVGDELLVGGGDGESFIHKVWQDGSRMWEELRFAVVPNNAATHLSCDLPPKHRMLDVAAVIGSSAEIADKIYHRQPFAQLVTPAVAAYIDRYGLYRGRVPSRVTRLSMEKPRWHLFADDRNQRAIDMVNELASLGGNFQITGSGIGGGEMPSPEQPPDAILVCGGDGTMLRAIRQCYHWRVPFFGANAGHLGFLLNDADEVRATPGFHRELILRQMPLLYIETQETPDGPWKSSLAFNDAWMERATSQSAWIEVTVNGRVRLPKLVCDGVLLSTASGSTAYARSMGATPLLADTPAWLLVGSNVMHPANWKSALLGNEQEIELRGLDNDKRALIGFTDGVEQGRICALRARVSRSAAVELAFLPSHDMAEKIAEVQFPQMNEQ